MKIAALVIVLILLAYFVWPRSNYSETGQVSELSKYFDLLQNSTPSYNTLIISAETTKDFLQFSRYENNIELDFPLVTEKQKALEMKFREACERLSLTVRETSGTDGARFLDVDLPSDISERVKITEKILTDVFGINENGELKFTFH